MTRFRGHHSTWEGGGVHDATARVTLRFSLESDAPARLELYNAGGRRLRTEAVTTAPGAAARHQFNRLDRLPVGIYHAKLVQGDRSDAVKLAVLQ